MFEVGDIVRVKEATINTLCKITYKGEDDNGVMWYECTPIEFNAISREFTEDKLEKIV